MPPEISDLIGRNIALIVLAVLIFFTISRAVRIVPQSEKFVVERFGRLHAVLDQDPHLEARLALETMARHMGRLDGPVASAHMAVQIFMPESLSE